MKIFRQNITCMTYFSIFLVILNAASPCLAAERMTCYHTDASGNVVVITNDAGTLVEKYAYSPYGKTLAQENTTINVYKFSGAFGITEELPDLYFMRARYYSASAARFLSTDPVKNIGPGWKYAPYEYSANNPVGYSDPGGDIVISATIALIFVLVTYIGIPVISMMYFASHPEKYNEENAENVIEMWETTTSLTRSASTMVVSAPSDYMLGRKLINSDPERRRIISKSRKEYKTQDGYGYVQTPTIDVASNTKMYAPTFDAQDSIDLSITDNKYYSDQDLSKQIAPNRDTSRDKMVNKTTEAAFYSESINKTNTNYLNHSNLEDIDENNGSTKGNVWKSIKSGMNETFGKVKNWFSKMY